MRRTRVFVNDRASVSEIEDCRLRFRRIGSLSIEAGKACRHIRSRRFLEDSSRLIVTKIVAKTGFSRPRNAPEVRAYVQLHLSGETKDSGVTNKEPRKLETINTL